MAVPLSSPGGLDFKSFKIPLRFQSSIIIVLKNQIIESNNKNNYIYIYSYVYYQIKMRI